MKSVSLDRIGTLGMLLTAIVTPCCFPLFGFVFSILGLGTFELFGGWSMYVFQAMVLLSFIGLIISNTHHKNIYPILISFVATLVIFYSYYIKFNLYLVYIGMVGVFIAAGLNYFINRKKKASGKCCAIDEIRVELKSTITCPNCGHKKEETMPTDSCQFFYKCENCKTVLKPKEGDCCVFCSYGSIPCPPIQKRGGIKSCC